MKRFGQPHVIVTDLLRSYGAAMKVIGNADRQETGRWLNNRAENSRPRPDSGLLETMKRGRFDDENGRCFGSGACEVCKKFVSVDASIHNHSNHERHLYSRANFKLNRAVALSEWRQLRAA